VACANDANPVSGRPEILLAEDERALREALTVLLTDAGYGVRTAPDGERALARYRERRPDLLLLDVMMPKQDGYAVCAEVRKTDVDTPVLFLTALDAEADELRGLGVGADQYVSKAVSPEVLLARIAAVLRRRGADLPGGDFDFGPWHIEASRLRMRLVDGTETALAEREVALLRWFVRHPDEVVLRDFLGSRFWGEQLAVDDNVINVAVFRLREKLGAAAATIRSVRRVGYVYRPQARS